MQPFARVRVFFFVRTYLEVIFGLLIPHRAYKKLSISREVEMYLFLSIVSRSFWNIYKRIKLAKEDI